MRIVVTGAGGFIGRNLCARLAEKGFSNVGRIARDTSNPDLISLLQEAEFVFHLAGANRPKDAADFQSTNVELTEVVCDALTETGRQVPLVYASSTQAELDNPYGRSKRSAEEVVTRYGETTGARAYVLRLPNVFGKWCKPYYNSVVATFCHQVANGEQLTVNDPAAGLRLLYIDDLIDVFSQLLTFSNESPASVELQPIYETTVGELAHLVTSFRASRESLAIPRVGGGFVRALYATYLSHLAPESFSYRVPKYVDPRGAFVEILKTHDSGQFSYFTAAPGVTRGEHYHHTKTEKFLVVSGKALFAFRNLTTDQTYEIVCNGGDGQIVDSVPGWVHRVTNVGEGELIVLLWASEVFDRNRPDTIASRVAS